jgi:DNA-binding CsgD family transcriptional regulator
MNSLTPREAAILDLLAEGLSNKDIGQRLCLDSNTVRSHLQHVYDKLCVENRTQAAALVWRMRVERIEEELIELRGKLAIIQPYIKGALFYNDRAVKLFTLLSEEGSGNNGEVVDI